MNRCTHFRRAVHAAAGVRLVPRHRADVDDVAAIAGHHAGGEGALEERDAGHVRLQHRVHVLWRSKGESRIGTGAFSFVKRGTLATFVSSIVFMSCGALINLQHWRMLCRVHNGAHGQGGGNRNLVQHHVHALPHAL